MHTLEQPTTLPSQEQIAVALGKRILRLREEHRAKAGKIFDEVARHEYVEELCAVCDAFEGNMNTKKNEKPIDNIEHFVNHMAFGQVDLDQYLIRFGDKELERVIKEAERQRYALYESYKKSRKSRWFPERFMYGEMYNVGGWDEKIFRLVSNVKDKAWEVVAMRKLLHKS